jgi:hypothetical protein
MSDYLDRLSEDLKAHGDHSVIHEWTFTEATPVYAGRGRFFLLDKIVEQEGSRVFMGRRLKLDGTRTRNGASSVGFVPVDPELEAEESLEIYGE